MAGIVITLGLCGAGNRTQGFITCWASTLPAEPNRLPHPQKWKLVMSCPLGTLQLLTDIVFWPHTPPPLDAGSPGSELHQPALSHGLGFQGSQQGEGCRHRLGCQEV